MDANFQLSLHLLPPGIEEETKTNSSATKCSMPPRKRKSTTKSSHLQLIFSSEKSRTQRETMASRTHRSWPVTARYVSRAAKARFPTTRAVPLSMRFPPPPKKGPLPAPDTPTSRRGGLATVLEARVPLFPKNSLRPNGLAMEQVPFFKNFEGGRAPGPWVQKSTRAAERR
jgi:hypothetical protein